MLVLSTFADQKSNEIESEEYSEYEETRKKNINERRNLFKTKEINQGLKDLAKKQSSKENRRKPKPILNSPVKKPNTRLQTQVSKKSEVNSGYEIKASQEIESKSLNDEKRNSEEMSTKGNHLV